MRSASGKRIVPRVEETHRSPVHGAVGRWSLKFVALGVSEALGLGVAPGEGRIDGVKALGVKIMAAGDAVQCDAHCRGWVRVEVGQ